MPDTLSLYEKAMPDSLPLFEKLLASRECGFDSTELCIDLDPSRQARLNWSKEERNSLRAFLLDQQMRLPTLSLSALRACPLGDPRPGQLAKAMELLEKSLQLCRELDTQILLINGYDVFDIPSTPHTVEYFAKNIEKAAALAADYGVILGIENAEKPFIDSIEKAASWVRRVNNPFFRIYGDVGNSYNAMNGNSDLAIADILQGQGLTAAMHLKDTMPGEYRYTPYGSGHVDFSKAVEACRKIGVHSYTAELFLRPDTDWKKEAMRANVFLKKFLGERA